MTRIDTQDYSRIFLHDIPLLDTRAPIEFNKGAFPNSTNLPLMTDEERAAVGTCYKRRGQQAAIALGHQLVSGEQKSQRLNAWLAFANQHPDGYLYCWRGGLRSQTVQQWLQEAGCNYPRIIGGYKALRHFLLEQQTSILADTPLIIIAGRTGCAKTQLLHQLPHSIDLEGIAKHRGSSFGKRVGGQPTQLNFENHLAIALLRCHHEAPHTPILLEDEGKLIGRNALPEDWNEAMRRYPLVVIEATLEERITHSYENYILNKLDEWQQHVDASTAFRAFADELQCSLDNIKKRLGGQRHQQLSVLLQQALHEHQKGDPSLHRAWIRIILTDYYDPMYDHQLNQKADRIIYRGSFAEIQDYLSSIDSIRHTYH